MSLAFLLVFGQFSLNMEESRQTFRKSKILKQTVNTKLYCEVWSPIMTCLPMEQALFLQLPGPIWGIFMCNVWPQGAA